MVPKSFTGFGVYLLGIAALIAVIAGVFLALSPYNLFPACLAETCLASEDLKAQNSMANAAWVMVFATAISIVVGIVSIVFLWRTLKTTQETVKISAQTAADARDAAQTAKQALQHDQEMGRSQIRCYPIVKSVMFDYSQVRPKLFLEVTNSGQTPVRTPYVSVVVDFIFLRGDGRTDGKTTAMAPFPDMAAGESDKIKIGLQYEFSDVHLDYIRDRKLMVAVYGEIMHSSIFGQERPYVFRYEGWPVETHNRVTLERCIEHIV